MSTQLLNIVLEGTTLRGETVASVAPELAKLIKRDNDFAMMLLSGQPTKIKSGVDAATGARYVEALQRIGVAARSEPETLEVDADLESRLSPAPAKVVEAPKEQPAGARPAQVIQTPRASPVTATDVAPEVTTEAFYKAWIGPKNQPYYLNYFAKAERSYAQEGECPLSWHWPAFFVTFGWFLYRKLYLAAILYFIVNLGWASLTVAGIVAANGAGNQSLAVTWVIVAVICWIMTFVLPATLANGLYYRHVCRKMKAAQAAHKEAGHQFREAGLYGGTSWPAVVVGQLINVGLGTVVALFTR